MDRRTAGVFLGLGLAAGFAAAAILLQADTGEQGDGVGSGSAPDNAVADTRLAERVEALESALVLEREARQLIEDELAALYTEIDSLQPATTSPQRAPGVAQSDATVAAALTERLRGSDDFLTRDQARRDALLDAGFSDERAAYIMRREDELRVAAMQARFEAQRSGDTQGMFEAFADGTAALREELGDAEYERYLEAMNRPTSVRVGNVLESSPGQRAGLRRGDEIVRYDGARVFDYTDLNRQQLEGAAGEDVVVEIVRDGVSMQIVMPRGPIGIEATRRWRR